MSRAVWRKRRPRRSSRGDELRPRAFRGELSAHFGLTRECFLSSLADIERQLLDELRRGVELVAFDAQIDEFGDKLVDFVKTANDEVTRSIAEVVRTALCARRGRRGA